MHTQTGQYTRIEYFDASFHDGSSHALWCVRATGTGHSLDWADQAAWPTPPDDEFEDSDGRIATRRTPSEVSYGDDDIAF